MSPVPDILSFIPLKMMVEMRNPDMTKKTSTPTKPDLKMLSGKAWKRTTEMTAIARKPSISGRYLRLRWELELTDELLWPVRGGISSKHLIYKKFPCLYQQYQLSHHSIRPCSAAPCRLHRARDAQMPFYPMDEKISAHGALRHAA